MPPTYFPLRWESTGDQWWFASPIDLAAANGHYDLVRELLRIDSNHLFKLTSLRRIRRLELVWDDDGGDQFHDVAKCRSYVARKLHEECESKKGKKKNDSLIRSGYGGWLMYTAASAGDLEFVRKLLERNRLLAFGEGEYDVTDVLYAAARSKNSEVFRLLFDFAVTGKQRGSLEEEMVPSVYRWEMTNRGVHAAARAGNLVILEDLLANSSDLLAYRDAQGSTVLHSAAARGQVEVIKYLTSSSFEIINSTDHQGNTALHVASYRGQLPSVEALVSASPSLISLRNNSGETFLHKAVSGFQSHAFRKLDRQVELLRELLRGKKFHTDEIINVRNTDGRTALHLATIGNIRIDLVQLLMTSPSINVNACDVNGMTPLDYIKQNPNSTASKVLIRKLIAAGGMFGFRGYNSRKAIASHLKMQQQGNGSSPGTSFRISDTQIFLFTGIENNEWDASSDEGSATAMSALPSSEHIAYDSAALEHRRSTTSKRLSSMNYAAAARLRRVFYCHKGKKDKRNEGFKKSFDDKVSKEIPKPLRHKYFRPSMVVNNKRNFSVRSYQSSPNAKKRFASGTAHGDAQSVPHVKVSGRSRSSSFSMMSSSVSSPRSMDKQKDICIIDNNDGASCSSQMNNDGDESETLGKRASSVSRKMRSRGYLCFGERSLLNARTTLKRKEESKSGV
ncbi:hypothetical protein S245_021159 [Arachis hypogaea]